MRNLFHTLATGAAMATVLSFTALPAPAAPECSTTLFRSCGTDRNASRVAFARADKPKPETSLVAGAHFERTFGENKPVICHCSGCPEYLRLCGNSRPFRRSP